MNWTGKQIGQEEIAAAIAEADERRQVTRVYTSVFLVVVFAIVGVSFMVHNERSGSQERGREAETTANADERRRARAGREDPILARTKKQNRRSAGTPDSIYRPDVDTVVIRISSLRSDPDLQRRAAREMVRVMGIDRAEELATAADNAIANPQQGILGQRSSDGSCYVNVKTGDVWGLGLKDDWYLSFGRVYSR